MLPPTSNPQEFAERLQSTQWPALPEKVNLLINVFTYDCRVGADVFSYCCELSAPLGKHPRIDNAVVSYTHGYPTNRVRNFAAQKAKADGFHFLLMLDDDMKPDVVLGQDPDAKPFLPTSLDFALFHGTDFYQEVEIEKKVKGKKVKEKVKALTHKGMPCIIGAPYCGAPPEQRVMVMKNIHYAPDMPDGTGVRLGSYTRDEAALMRGIQRVSALPTGCLLIDLRVLDVLPPPWFDYEYADPPFNTALASTEDIVFTRNLDWLEVPQYCNWDGWAGHMKRYLTGKPRLSPVDAIPDSIRKAWFEKGWRPSKLFSGLDVVNPQVNGQHLAPVAG